MLQIEGLCGNSSLLLQLFCVPKIKSLIIKGAKEMAHFVRALAIQAWEPEFGCWNPYKKLGGGGMIEPIPVTSALRRTGTGRSFWLNSLTQKMMKFRFNERSCLKGIRWSVMEEDTRHLSCVCVHMHGCEKVVNEIKSKSTIKTNKENFSVSNSIVCSIRGPKMESLVLT